MLNLSEEGKKLVLADLRRRITETKFHDYKPYPKQRAFHEAGASYRERLFMAANQVGKTLAGGAEGAVHLTGRYPSWWRGKVFYKPIVMWAAGLTFEKVKDGAQRWLFGRPGAWGTGMVPKDAMRDFSMRTHDVIDTAQIKWGGGGDVQARDSIITLKAYEQGVDSFASEEIDLGWADEEPDKLGIYTEFLTRTNNTNGSLYMTFTPLRGMSDVVTRFLLVKDDDPAKQNRSVTYMTIDEAEHYTPQQREIIRASYPAHELEARTKGVPIMGSGLVFPVDDERIKWKAAAIPSHWPRIAAIDFGLDHPTAVVWLAWDRDNDVVYVYDVYRLRQEPSIAVHASSIKARGAWIPMAWPHDGANDTAQGPQLAKQYKTEGVNMRHERAQFAETTDNKQTDTKQSRVSVEAGVQEMYSRMLGQRLRVADHLLDWFEEKRMYHRKDGKIVKLRDDLMCATRYGIMDLRYAITQPTQNKLDPNRPVSWRH